MKRIVLCFDGTWNTLANPDEATNVVRVGQALKPVASDGVQQIVYYNSGVGSGGPVDQLLGGVFGAGLKGNVKRGLTFLSFNYNTGDNARRSPRRDLHFRFLARRLHRACAGRRDRGDRRHTQGVQLRRGRAVLDPLQEEQGEPQEVRTRRSRPSSTRCPRTASSSSAWRSGTRWDRTAFRPGRLRRPGAVAHLVDAQLPRQRDQQAHRVRLSRHGDRRAPARVLRDRVGDRTKEADAEPNPELDALPDRTSSRCGSRARTPMSAAATRRPGCPTRPCCG